MQGINRVTLVGNLGDDPVGRTTPGGTVVSNFSVATGKKWRDKQTGEQKEHTEWHRVASFGKLAEICNQWLKKGSPVYLEGELRTRKWQDKEGHDRYSTEIIASELRMLGGNRPDKDDAGEAAPPPPRPRPAAEPPPFEDDIPF